MPVIFCYSDLFSNTYSIQIIDIDGSTTFQRLPREEVDLVEELIVLTQDYGTNIIKFSGSDIELHKIQEMLEEYDMDLEVEFLDD